MSRAGELIRDPKAEQVVSMVDYDFSRNRMPKGLQIYMAIRACILDELARRFLRDHPGAAVVHLGCGLDSRCERVAGAQMWYDLDFPDVIEVRKRFYPESDRYHMIGSDATDLRWLDRVADCPTALVIAEGMTMYLTEQQMRNLVLALRDKFGECELVFDAYSLRAVRLSRRHNPVNKMGAQIRWGLDDPSVIEGFGAGIRCGQTRYFTDYPGIATLPLRNRLVFALLYQNPVVKQFYRIFAFQIKKA